MKINRNNLFILLITVLLVLPSCQKDEVDGSTAYMPMIVKDVFFDRVTAQASLVHASDALEKGFLISTAADFSPENTSSVSADRVEGNYFCTTIVGLEAGTQYYVRPYLVRGSGNRLEGTFCSFRTPLYKIYPMTIASLAEGEQVADVTAKSAVVLAQALSLGNEDPSLIDPSIVGTSGNSANMGVFNAVQVLEKGAYYWTDEQSEAHAGKVAITSFSPVAAMDYLDVALSGLNPDTEYNVKLYARNGLNLIPAPYAIYHEVYAQPQSFRFRTKPLLAPSPETTPRPSPDTDVTARTAVLYGSSTDGNDPECEFGFYYGLTESDLVRIVADKVERQTDEAGNSVREFQVTVRDLQVNSSYFVKAFARNDRVESYGETVTIHTAGPSAPIIVTTENEYAWRVAHFTPQTIVIRTDVMSDGGSDLTKMGVLIADRLEDVENATLDALGVARNCSQSEFDETTSVILTTVDNLSGGKTYYYKPYAVNGEGACYGDVLTVRTPVSGGAQFVYDASANKPSQANPKLVRAGVELVYHELDPVELSVALDGDSGNPLPVRLYFLDRNLGATKPCHAIASNYLDYPETVGYYYQFGQPLPSATPDLLSLSRLTETYGYSQKGLNGVAGSLWYTDDNPRSNPCPAGYDVPTRWIFDAVRENYYAAPNNNIKGGFSTFLFGVSCYRKADGSMMNQASSEADFWTANRKANDGTRAVRFYANSTQAVVNDNQPVNVAFPVRCVRVEVVN